MRMRCLLTGYVLLTCLVLPTVPTAFAQTAATASIHGVVTDSRRKPVEGVQLTAVHAPSGNAYRAQTDDDGRFALRNLALGSYVLTTGHMGYREHSRELTLSAGSETNLNIMLTTEAVDLDALVVVGTRAALARALEQKRRSTNIREVTLADDVGKLPDRNLADAISRLAGVSIQQGVGDARYVSIRGISPDLNQVNVNGQISAISDIDARAGRSGPLDVVGAGDFATIEVVKTLTPDMDAQGLGGQINVSTPSALEQGGRFAFAQADYGGNNANDQQDYSFNVGYGDVRLDDRLGVYVGGSYSNRSVLFDRLEGVWGQLEGGAPIPTRQMLKRVDETRERISVSGNLEYEFNERSNVYLRAVLNQVDEVGQRDETESQLDRASVQLTSPTSGTSDRIQAGQLKTRVQDSRRKILNLTLGADHDFGNRSRFRWEPSFTYSTASEDRDINFIEFDMDGRVTGTFEVSRYVYEIDTPDRLNVDNYVFDKIRFDGGLQDENLFVVQNDVTWTPEISELFGRPGGLRAKFGAKAILRDRSVNEYSDRYETIEDLRLSGLAVSGPRDFRSRFDFGPVVDARRMNEYFNANPELFRFQEQASLLNSVEDDYDAVEDIYAAYGMVEAELGGLTLLAGARFEHTDVRMRADQANFINDEFQGLQPRDHASSYGKLLPNVQVRYAAADNVIVRAAFTTSIGRPDFVDLAPKAELEAVELEPGVFMGSISEGNPDLQPFEAQNFDLALEYYFAPGALLASSFFHKRVDNPVFGRRLQFDNVERDGRFFELLTVSSVENAVDGRISGLDLTYQHQFTFLPGPLGGLGIALNAAFMDSEVDVFDREEPLPFFTQPDRIFNAQLFFERAPLQVRLAYQHAAESLIQLGNGPEQDVFEDARQAMDAKVTYGIPQRLLRLPGSAFAFVEAQNITGENRRRFQGRSGHLFLDEQFASVYRAGLSWRF